MQLTLQGRPCRTAFLALGLLATWLCWPPGNLHVQPARRPNILLILSDDQGWGDLSVNGNTNLKTPNIDAIARRGATLDRFYVQPVCSPTRAELLTGRYHPAPAYAASPPGLERINLDEIDARPVASVPPAIARARSANGTMAANGPTIPTPAASRNSTASPPATGANTSTRRWNTTASPCAARATSPTISPTRRLPSSRKSRPTVLLLRRPTTRRIRRTACPTNTGTASRTIRFRSVERLAGRRTWLSRAAPWRCAKTLTGTSAGSWASWKSSIWPTTRLSSFSPTTAPSASAGTAA